MSIFVAIATIGDNQLSFTVEDIFEKADNPNDIFVGIAYMQDEHYFNEDTAKYKDRTNIKYKRWDPAENVGVGRGRGNAHTFYNNEDYILQIDSHTKFEKGWDTILINTLKEAKESLRIEKIVLTSYLPRYVHRNGAQRDNVGPSKALYSFLNDNKRPHRQHIWACDNLSLLEMEFDPRFKQKGSNKKKFLPAMKVCGGFIFGEKDFAQNTGLPKECLFWSEEIIQSINLLHYGFAMVFPNIAMPLRHLYANDVERGPADRVSQILEYYGLSGADDDRFYLEWINDPENKERVERFAKYANFHPLTGSINILTIPDQYNL